jgi:hypothetical protein
MDFFLLWIPFKGNGANNRVLKGSHGVKKDPALSLTLLGLIPQSH